MPFSINSKLGDILKSPAASAALEKFIPGIANNPKLKMLQGLSLSQLPQNLLPKGLPGGGGNVMEEIDKALKQVKD